MATLKTELTTMDLTRMFDVSRQSIFNWRRGEGDRPALPYYKLGGNGLSDPTRYSLEAVKQFANETGRILVNEIFVGGVKPINVAKAVPNNE